MGSARSRSRRRLAGRGRTRPEVLLLLALARGDPRPPAILGTDGDEIGGQAFLDLARRHQVDALAYWHLRQSSSAGWDRSIPPGLRESLRQAYLYHYMRNESLFGDLQDIAGALGKKGIDSVIFKGPWLAICAYPATGTRAIDDVDLCIHEQDYAGAVEALEGLGYRPDSVLPTRPQAALQQAHYGRQLRFHARRRRMVELHFRMINMGPPAPSEPWLWKRREALQVGSSTIHVPDAESMLLHLCLHANQHGFGVLRLLYDLRFALASLSERLEAHRFVSHAQRERCGPAVFHSLALAQRLAGASVPDALMDALRPGWLRRRIYGAAWRLSDVERLKARRRPNSLESPLLYLLEMGRLRDKARYLRGMIAEAGGVRPLVRTAWTTAARARRASP